MPDFEQVGEATEVAQDAGNFDPLGFIGGMFGGLGGGGGSAQPTGEKPQSGRGRSSSGGQGGGTKGKLVYAREKVDRLVSVADNLVQQFVDHAAGMTVQERDMIVPPLAELVAESKELAKVAGLSNSISLVVGLSVWSFRIIAVWRYKHPDKPTAQQAAQDAGLAGVALDSVQPDEDIFNLVREEMRGSRAFILPNGVGASGDAEQAIASMVEVPINDFGAGGPTGHSRPGHGGQGQGRGASN